MLKNFCRFLLFKQVVLTLCLWSLVPLEASSCAGGDWFEEDDPLSFVEPSVIGQDLFKNEFIFYSEPYGMGEKYPPRGPSSQYYYNIISHTEVEKANVLEWKAYLNETRGVAVGREGIIQYFYGEVPYDLRNWLRQEPEARSDPKGPKLQMKGTLESQKDIQDYMGFVKRLDPVLSRMTAGEQYDPASRKWVSYSGDKAKDLRAFLEEAERRAGDGKLDEFMRMKYGFHLVRMAATADLNSAAIRYYDRYIGNREVAPLTRYRALGYKAKALKGTGSGPEALRAYLNIIDQCPPLRLRELQSVRSVFQRQDLLAHAATLQNKHKLTSLHYVLGILDPRDHSTESLERMLTTGPQEAQAEAAFLRCLLNIEKENFLFDRLALIGLDREELMKGHSEAFSGPGADPQYNDEWNLARKKKFEDSTKKGKYGPWLALCGKFAADPKTRQPTLWSCMASYLALLEGDVLKAERLYGEALAKKTKNAQLRKQVHLIGTLIALQKAKGSIPRPLQNRLMEDLAWAATLGEQGNNSGIHHSLLALLAQKHLVLKDLPRAALCFAAIGSKGYWRGYYNEYALYLMDAVMDDRELDALRSVLKATSSSPLDAWVKKRSALVPDDIQVLRAVRQARVENYQAALTLLEKVSPSYLKFVKRVKDENGYWREASHYKGSSWVQNKAFIFQREFVFIDPKAPVEQMDIVSYFKMVKDLKSKVDAAKAKKDEVWCSLAYELASILGTQMLTGWPEVRRSINLYSEKYIEEYPGEVAQKYPFKIPGVTEFMDGRYKGFLEGLKNYNKRAFALCSEVIQADLDPEVTARSLAFASVMEASWIKSYDPQAPTAQERLKRLRDRYSGTEFYKRYVTWCGPLKVLAGSH